MRTLARVVRQPDTAAALSVAVTSAAGTDYGHLAGTLSNRLWRCPW